MENLSRVGPYTVLRKLGQGGMGAVFVARHDRLQRTVALKILTAPEDDQTHASARFKREAECAMALSHPGLVKVYDHGSDAGRQYIAMELVEGTNLAEMLASGGPLPPPRAAKIAREILEALEVCHEAGLLHRDLKPANVMVDATGRARLLDLGLVKPLDRTILTQTGSRIGTPRYMPPEMLTGGDADRRSDLYQVGLVLHECLTGRPAFGQGKFDELVRAIDGGQRSPLPHAPGLAEVVNRLCSRAPEDRFASCGEALRALDAPRRRARSQPTVTPAPRVPAGSGGTLLPRPPVPRAALAFFALVAVLGIGAAALFAPRPRRDPGPPPSPPRPAIAVRSAGPVEPQAGPTAARMRAVLEALRPANMIGELKREVVLSVSARAQAQAAARWQKRLADAFGAPEVARATADFAKVVGRLADDASVTREDREKIVYQMSTVEDLFAMAELGLAVAPPIGLGRIAPPGIRIETALPPGLTPIWGLRFGGGGVLARRPPLALPVPWTDVPGSAMFNSEANAFFGAERSRGARKSYERPGPTVTRPLARAYLGFRVAGGVRTERLRFACDDAASKFWCTLGCVRGSGRVQEGYLRIDERGLDNPAATLKISFGNRDSVLGGGGITLDHLVLYGVPR